MGRKRKAEPQKTKTDRHGIRMRLLRAGETLFGQRGVHRSQVSQLADEAGVSVGAFYRYFRDKDELYRELLSGRFNAYLDEMRGLLENVDQLGVVERVELLRAVFRRSFEIHLSDPDTFSMWYRHAHDVSDEMAELVESFNTEAESVVADILNRTITVGRALPTGQRKALATTILGMTNAMAHRMIVHGTPSIDDAVELCTRLTAAGLLGFAPPELRSALLAAYDKSIAG